MLDVMLGGFGRVVMGMMAMAAGGMGMMGGNLVIVFLIMPGGFAVMAGGFFVMRGGAMMMVAGGMLVRHGVSPIDKAAQELRGGAIKHWLQEAKMSAAPANERPRKMLEF